MASTSGKSVSVSVPTLAEALEKPMELVPVGHLNSIVVSHYHEWKIVWELPLALLLAIPALAITALLIVLVRLTSAGPGIYSQVRTGKNGRTFKMFKLRSMYIDAEKRGAMWCAGDQDPRITPLGRWLRKLHLDELPQVINVIRGDMSFCGPRPERPEFVSKLERAIPYYTTRLAVRPGVTGFSQINLPPDTSLQCVHRKQTLDLEYIENASLWSDLKMIICTALRLIGFSGTAATKLSGLSMRPSDSRFSLYYDCNVDEPTIVPSRSRRKPKSSGRSWSTEDSSPVEELV